jgi:hypothetical protein
MVRHVSGPSEAPVPPHAITVMIGVPMEGTAAKDRRGRKGVDKIARKKSGKGGNVGAGGGSRPDQSTIGGGGGGRNGARSGRTAYGVSRIE